VVSSKIERAELDSAARVPVEFFTRRLSRLHPLVARTLRASLDCRSQRSTRDEIAIRYPTPGRIRAIAAMILMLADCWLGCRCPPMTISCRIILTFLSHDRNHAREHPGCVPSRFGRSCRGGF